MPHEMTRSKFFADFSSLDPSSVRLIAPTLDFSGLTTPPRFLFRLDTVPPESLLVLADNGFPLVFDGMPVVAFSMRRPGEWMQFALSLCRDTGINLSPALTVASTQGNIAAVRWLCRFGASPEDAMKRVAAMSHKPDHYYLIVRELVRYGASYSQDLHHLTTLDATRNGRAIPPVMDDGFGVGYFNLNELEQDIAIKTDGYGDRDVIMTDTSVMTWPYYIQDKRTNSFGTMPCPTKRFIETVALENPPGFADVIDASLR